MMVETPETIFRTGNRASIQDSPIRPFVLPNPLISLCISFFVELTRLLSVILVGLRLSAMP